MKSSTSVQSLPIYFVYYTRVSNKWDWGNKRYAIVYTGVTSKGVYGWDKQVK